MRQPRLAWLATILAVATLVPLAAARADDGPSDGPVVVFDNTVPFPDPGYPSGGGDQPWTSTAPAIQGGSLGYQHGHDAYSLTLTFPPLTSPGADNVCRTDSVMNAANGFFADGYARLLLSCAASGQAIVRQNAAAVRALVTRPPAHPPTTVVPLTTGDARTQPADLGSGAKGGSDPVNPVNGAFVLQRQDLAVPAPGVSFTLLRAYSSRLAFDGPLGYGWDHNYDQRIVPITADSCDGEVVYSMGLGATMRFEVARSSDTEVIYKPERPVHFTLRQLLTGGVSTGWQVSYPDGATLSFDERGLLARIEDSSHMGLDFMWEAAAAPILWRLSAAIDAGQRVYTFHYNSSGRIDVVSEPTSYLHVDYRYDDSTGDLLGVTDGFGRSEGYEYALSIPVPIIQDAPSEEQLRASCEDYCAPAADTCHSGGGCDEAIDRARQDCYGKIVQCKDDCTKTCHDRIVPTSGDLHAQVVAECNQPSDGRKGCFNVTENLGTSCDFASFVPTCQATTVGEAFGCQEAMTGMTLWSPLPSTLSCAGSCGSNADCNCVIGAECKLGSCVAPASYCGQFAKSSCQHNSSEACETLTYQNCVSSGVLACEQQAVLGCAHALSEDCPAASVVGCTSHCTTDSSSACLGKCISDPDQGCDPVNWNAERCDGVDWSGICQSACVPECMKVARGSDTEKPRYGNFPDFGHNLMKVKDGDGRVYLENHYGTDPSKPDFDAVQSQDMGGQTTRVYYRDLQAEKEFPELRPNDVTRPLVKGLDAYQSDELCPAYCAPQDVGGNAPTEYVPWAGNLLVVRGESTVGGLPVSGGNAILQPNVVKVIRTNAGVFAQPVHGAAFPPSFAFSLTTPHGVATFQANLTVNGVYGNLKVIGATAVQNDVIAFGELTLVTQGRLRVYRGAPQALIKIVSGTCSQTFQATQGEDAAEVTISPMAACDGDLTLAPLATVIEGPSYTDLLRRKGETAFNGTDLFRPDPMEVTRSGLLLTKGSGGGYRISVAFQHGEAPTTLFQSAMATISLSAFFSAPWSDAVRPIVVFHVPFADRPTNTLLNPLYDTGHPFAPEPYTSARCSPMAGGAPIAREGPKPITATVMVDGYGTARVFYYDEHGNNLRTENGSTHEVRSFTYDSFGDVSGAQQPLNDRQCVVRDAFGDVTSVTTYPVPSSDGISTPLVQRFAYQYGPVRLTKVFDPARTLEVDTTYDWNAQGQIRSSTDALGHMTTYQVEPWGAPHQITGYDGTVTTIDHDPVSGLPTRVEVNDGAYSTVSTTAYDAAGRPRQAVSPLGAVTSWTWSQDRNVVSQNPGPYLFSLQRQGGEIDTKTLFTYNTSGQVQTSVRDGITQTTVVYDSFGLPMRITAHALDLSAADVVHCLKHGQNGRVDAEVLPDGTRRIYSYDGEGRHMATIQGYVAPESGGWDDGCPGLAAPTTGITSATVESIQYDADGRAFSLTDARNKTSFIGYDGFGRPISFRDPDLNQKRVGYDVAGQVVWTASYDATALRNLYNYPTFDDPGLLAANEFVHDALGRVTLRQDWRFDESDHHRIGTGMSLTQFGYDDLHRKVRVTDGDGYVTETTYDGIGRPTARLLPNGVGESFVYSDGGRLTRHNWSERGLPRHAELQSNELGLPVSFEAVINDRRAPLGGTSYDQRGRPITRTNAAGFATRYTYDAFDRLQSTMTAPDSASYELVSFGYDAMGRVRKRSSFVNVFASADTTFSFDVLGRPTGIQRPAGVNETYLYDGASPLMQYYQDGITSRSYTYDGEGRVTNVWAQRSDSPNLVFRRFQYDGLGRPTLATDSGDSAAAATDDIVTHLDWDSTGNRTREWNSIFGESLSVTHGYDEVGQPIASTLGGQVVARTFDSVGRETSISLDGSREPTVRFSYLGGGGATQRTYANGVTTTYSYDSLGRLSGLKDIRNGARLAEWTWGIPIDGVPRVASFNNGSSTISSKFRIDGSGRVAFEDHGIAGSLPTSGFELATSADANDLVGSPSGSGMGSHGWGSGQAGGGWRTFALDGRSNWINEVRQGFSISTTLNLLDQYVAFGGQTPTYFGNGAMKSFSNQTYQYNAFGDISDVAVSGSEARHYRYDGFGRRVVDHRGSMDIQWLFDGARRVMTRKLTGSGTSAPVIYVDGQGLDEHLVRIDTGVPTTDTARRRNFYHQDRTNSVYLVTTGAGAVADRYQYTAYGEMTILGADGLTREFSTMGNPFGFQGQVYDTTSKLVDMRARLYNPNLGRFISPDPIGLAGGPNLFGFANGAPSAAWDPMGLDFGPFDKNYVDNGITGAVLNRDADGNFTTFDISYSSGTTISLPVDQVPIRTLYSQGTHATISMGGVHYVQGPGGLVYPVSNLTGKYAFDRFNTPNLVNIRTTGAATAVDQQGFLDNARTTVIMAVQILGSMGAFENGVGSGAAQTSTVSRGAAAEAPVKPLQVLSDEELSSATANMAPSSLGEVSGTGSILRGFHGAPGDTLLKILDSGHLEPSNGEIFLADALGGTLKYGADSARGMSLSFELDASIGEGVLDVRWTAGAPRTFVVLGDTPIPVSVVRLFARMSDGEGGFMLQTIEGEAAIRAFLSP